MRLVQNLIGNSLKYNTSDNPVIEVGCEEKEEHFLFSVRDNGISIEPKYRKKIFLLFPQMNTANGSSKGTGVGLAICKKIVEWHGGTIWVDSKEDKGNTFYFTIAKKQY